MNRVVLQSAEPVQQQIMATAAGAPNWWSVNYTRHPSPPPPPPPPPHHPFLGAPNTSNNNSSSYYDLFSPLYPPTTATHESLSQLLLGGLVNVGGGGEEGKCTVSQLFHPGSNNNNNNCNDNWDQDEVERSRGVRGAPLNIAIKQENPAVAAAAGNHGYVYGSRDGAINGFDSRSSMLDFSNNRSNKGDVRHNPPPPDHHHHHRSSPECNSTGTSGALNKRARVQSPSSPFKVRKEKLGDRITALHQLVSPFGKTDTASVLLEAIGYIRFLQSQIEALSLPYLATSASATCRTHPHPAQGERNCIFPEHPGQLLNNNCMKRKGAPEQEYEEMPKKDLKSRGLCLVPVSCTLQVGSDNGADYWAPAPLGGPFDR